MANHLEELGRRLEEDPFFLACPLHHYAKSEGMDEMKMAEKLACTRETLVLLRLCRAPSGAGKQFRKDIDHITSRFPVDADVLAEAIRRGQAIFQLKGKSGAGKGTLLAARDGEKKKDDKKDQGS